ncbi:hypothetical protein DL98DRAFT_156915 [Cadophora sp. DSE1049]|nr:hypothetical protein DL98DRAFT_156915 [Cadophora sp. DSE1049]
MGTSPYLLIFSTHSTHLAYAGPQPSLVMSLSLMHTLFQNGNPLSLICEWQNAVQLEGISDESTGFRPVRGVLMPFVSTATSAGALRVWLTALFQIPAGAGT